MSSQDFTKKTDKIRKELNTLRKDINYRDQQDKRGEATYTLDAEINGQFTQISQTLSDVEMMVTNFRNNFKDYNITVTEANKRYKVYEQLINEKNSLKRSYDALFEKKSLQRQKLNLNTENSDNNFDKKYDAKTLSTKDLHKLREQQEQEQDEALDQLIQNVRGLKGGQVAIKDELSEQQQLINTLDNKMDDNIDNISSARRRMTKLLQSSSNCCLISVMIVEIVAIVLIWTLIH